MLGHASDPSATATTTATATAAPSTSTSTSTWTWPSTWTRGKRRGGGGGGSPSAPLLLLAAVLAAAAVLAWSGVALLKASSGAGDAGEGGAPPALIRAPRPADGPAAGAAATDDAAASPPHAAPHRPQPDAATPPGDADALANPTPPPAIPRLPSTPLASLMPMPDFSRRWWLARSANTGGGASPNAVALPFRWSTDPRAVETRLLPCESGRKRGDASACDASCPAPIPEGRGPDGRPLPHWASCAANEGVYCDPAAAPASPDSNASSLALPVFSFVPPRAPFSLADAVVELLRRRRARARPSPPPQRSTPSHATPLVLTFIGDSTQEYVFNWAKCHLGRTRGVRVPGAPGAPRAPSIWTAPKASAPSADEKSAIKWVRRAAFDVDLPAGLASGPAAGNAARETPALPQTAPVETLLVRNDRPIPDAARMFQLCARSDLFVVNWGLHYSSPGASSSSEPDPAFSRDMAPALRALARCASEAGTVVALVTHPAQHFKTPMGWFTGGFNAPCGALRGRVEDADWWTKHLRAAVAKLRSDGVPIDLVPVPWLSPRAASCPRGAGVPASGAGVPASGAGVPASGAGSGTGKAASKASTAARIHYVPFFDVSAALWEWHMDRVGRHEGARAHDCTHLVSLPEFGVPIWDALYWAALHERRLAEASCGEPPRSPAYESGPRGDASDAALDANIRALHGRDEAAVSSSPI